MRYEVHTSERGQAFQVRLAEKPGEFDIIVSPREELAIDVYSDEGIRTEFASVYIADSPGAWVLTRDASSGKPVSAAFYFSTDSGVYIKFTPGDKKCFADLMIFGVYAARGVEVGVPFERLYTASLADIKKWTPSIPWFYTYRPNSRYEGVRQMIAVIRENQKRYVFVPDAAYNENGEPVDILSGERRGNTQQESAQVNLEFSDAGFLKWIVDGLAVPFAGSYTILAPLLTPTVIYKTGSFQGSLSLKYNLSFALDWTRNLAAAMLSVKTGKTYTAANSGVDVAVEPFSLSQSTTYTINSGYQAEGLLPLLYVLAVTEPDMFYLAAIRQTDYVSPEVRFFSKSAAIFPYFDEAGRFNVTVFENGTDISLSQFISKYKKDSVHLTRVESSTRFFPQ
jgi:hypothetical protein